MRRPVEKVRITTAHNDVNNLLIELQRHSILMLERKNQISQSEKNNWLSRIENVVRELSKNTKESLFKSLDTSYENYSQNYLEELNWFEEIENRLFKINNLTDRTKNLETEISKLSLFSKLNFKILPNDELKHVYVKLGVVSKKDKSEFDNLVNLEQFNKINVEVYEEVDNATVLFVWSMKEDKLLVDELTRSEVFKETDLTNLTVPANEYFSDLKNEYENNLLELNKTKELSLADTNELDRIKLLYEKINNEIVLEEVLVHKTERVSYLNGWVKKKDLNHLNEILKDLDIVYELEILKASNEEVVPTAIENNKFVQPFEAITNVFSIPNVNEVDPNPSMAVWYWLIFGIMMADIGYGLVLLLGGIFLLKIPKLGKGIKDLGKVFTYSSVAGIIGGILFGSFFGYSFDLARFLGLPFDSKIIDTVSDPLPMLALSIVIGFLHIMTGLILKIINSFKQKKYYDMLSQGFSWLFILLGIALYVLLPKPIVGLVFIIVGVLLILLFNGANNKTIVSKAFGGVTGLFGVTSYLSDILSYTRILALALSSAVIAFTMNLLAEMVMGGVVGIFFAIIIYIIGHIFNLAMSLLSTYVHDGRLQYIEFYGKFFEGDGVLFEPFKIELNYYQSITN